MSAASWKTRRVAALLAATSIAGAVIAGAVFGAPAAANAATEAGSASPTQVVQFSTDGIHWSNNYTGYLFSGVWLIPAASSTRSFYIRNGAMEPALLQITLADVTTNNVDYANALSISSSTPGAPGAPVPVTAAQPCYTLAQGLRLASGDSTRIDNTATLADLTGTTGQGGTASFELRITLSSTDAAAPLPNTCPAEYGVVDTFADPTEGETAPAALGTTAPSATVYHRTAKGWTPGTSVAGATVSTPTTPTVPEKPTAPLASTLVANTARFYQEYDVAFWLAMSALGALIVILVRRRRAEGQPQAPDTIEQIGTRR